MNRWLVCLVVVLMTPLAALAQTAPAPPAAAKPAIEAGSNVQIAYTLKEDGGEVIETSEGRGPVTYTQGDGQLVPGLERAMLGLRPGDEKKVVVKPEEAYGILDPAAVTEVPRNMIPAESLKVGTMLMARSAQGDSRPVRVKEIKDSTVILDLNHPLAGKTLVFDVRVLAVTAPAGAPKPSK